MKTNDETRAECAAREQRVANGFDILDAYAREVLARYHADLEAENRRRADCWSGAERRSFRAMRHTNAHERSGDMKC